MPKSALETNIDKATNENNVNEDWGLLFEIVDQINQTNSEKEALRLITKKLNDKDPHVVKHTLTLLHTCVSNCGRNFKLEVCSRNFINELKNFLLNKKITKLSSELAAMIEKWVSEKEFKSDPALNLLPTLYSELKMSGVNFKPEAEPGKSMKSDPDLIRREEEELARAIQLSLKETKTPNNSTSSLYSTLSQSSQKISQNFSAKRKVKALYDFEAVEDNEITFKAGDVLMLTDDSDQNWWKAVDTEGTEGLFPSNFVTFDLEEKVERADSAKKVTFSENVDVNLIEEPRQLSLYIDEAKIDKCIEMLQNSDPTGEIQPDSQELLDLEEECYMMGPLIDQKLQLIDQKHSQLEDLNVKIIESFQMYNNLMKESITKASGYINPMMSVNGQANPQYVAAPPSIEQNSMQLANQLSSMSLNMQPQFQPSQYSTYGQSMHGPYQNGPSPDQTFQNQYLTNSNV